MSQRYIRLLGLAAATSVGLALFYLGSRAVSHSRGGPATTKPAPPKGQPAVPNDHEAKMLAEELKRKPGHVPVLFRLAQLAEQSGHPKDAVPFLRDILKQEPNNQDALLELGRVLFDTGDVAGALEQTNRVLEMQPGQPDALYNLGAVYANIGNAELARKYWQRLVQSSPQSESGLRAKESLGRLPAQSR
jgi:tetratricopeptide (TPR) repeat protein